MNEKKKEEVVLLRKAERQIVGFRRLSKRRILDKTKPTNTIAA
jgi:hypothetical protein